MDTGDRAALAGRIRGADTVVNALPYHLAITAAEVALACGCHYFDLTEDVAATGAIKKLAHGAKTAFMPQCGLAPGFIGIVAHHLASGFQSVRDVKMRVGALPAFPTNALKYNLRAWSTSAWMAPSTRPSTPPVALGPCARPGQERCKTWTTRPCVTPATAN